MMKTATMLSQFYNASKLRPVLQPVIRDQVARSMTLMSKDSAEEFKKTNYSSRMKKLGRPVSPHVTIYAFPIAAISSITNRVTGCCLAAGAAGLGAAEILGGSGTALSLMQTIGSQGMLVTAAAKFTVAWIPTYHYLGAIRHFIWDSMPNYVNTHDVEKTSYWIFGAATVISGTLMFV